MRRLAQLVTPPTPLQRSCVATFLLQGSLRSDTVVRYERGVSLRETSSFSVLLDVTLLEFLRRKTSWLTTDLARSCVILAYFTDFSQRVCAGERGMLTSHTPLTGSEV